MHSYRIAIVGSPEAVSGFALLGVQVIAVSDAQSARTELFRLKKEMTTSVDGLERNVYAIVFVTEDLMTAVTPDDEKLLVKGALPAIIPLPSHRGSSGYGLARLKRLVERAVGSNVLN
ncbi:V-type ATP synthase subunit F [Candidatus Peregrinibacteria bacterium CG22_combo_CG10-13_8_21_14_all_49_11]|nr:MAG: V-type ATP synthase subunit F [Candidatus Peregrinibacteria bacterium CG22_combo_CG10-13_8_21_14_all_49_11]